MNPLNQPFYILASVFLSLSIVVLFIVLGSFSCKGKNLETITNLCMMFASAATMSCSSASASSGWEGRYLNAYCKCGKRAGIRISESADNPNKFYYCCQQNVCGTFLGWCHAADTFRSTSTRDTIESQPVFRGRAAINDLKDEIMCLQIENRKVYEKIADFENSLGFMKMMIVVCVICTLFLFILVLVMLVGKMA